MFRGISRSAEAAEVDREIVATARFRVREPNTEAVVFDTPRSSHQTTRIAEPA